MGMLLQSPIEHAICRALRLSARPPIPLCPQPLSIATVHSHIHSICRGVCCPLESRRPCKSRCACSRDRPARPPAVIVFLVLSIRRAAKKLALSPRALLRFWLNHWSQKERPMLRYLIWKVDDWRTADRRTLTLVSLLQALQPLPLPTFPPFAFAAPSLCTPAPLTPAPMRLCAPAPKHYCSTIYLPPCPCSPAPPPAPVPLPPCPPAPLPLPPCLPYSRIGSWVCPDGRSWAAPF